MRTAKATLIWVAIALVVAVPVAMAAASPLLKWRDAIYIVAGLAGVLGFALMFVQPLLIGGYAPGVPRDKTRGVHRLIGGLIFAAVAVHVVGLWMTSPPDVIDALLFRSPTLFSPWGVVAMWAIIVVAVMVALRQSLGFSPRTWRAIHTALVSVTIVGTAVHTLLIEGTMEPISKAVLCVLVVAVTVKVVADMRVWRRRARRR
ncbi:MAG: ferric reductase-like transmembrane domain-containing protein [Hyphomicrobiaceae bacterium]|nr:ferric reductase-like transmembrane domain-containing protein [Hyphomicrobiaceae bacterium]